MLFYLSSSMTYDHVILNTLEFTNTKDPEGCDCVPYYLCKNRTIKTDGDGLIDIRFVLQLIFKYKGFWKYDRTFFPFL